MARSGPDFPVPTSPRRCRVLACVGLGLLAAMARALTAPTETPTMRVDELRPGMIGETYTVLSGQTIVPLKTEVLGVARNFLGPGRDMIIGKLVDPRTDLTGAVHGMSGSPLYVDGKLVGALSRDWSALSRTANAVSLRLPICWRFGRWARALRTLSEDPSVSRWVPRFNPFRRPRHQILGEALSLPLSVSGMSAPLTNRLLAQCGLRDRGFMAAPGGGGSGDSGPGPEALQPGSTGGRCFYDRRHFGGGDGNVDLAQRRSDSGFWASDGRGGKRPLAHGDRRNHHHAA